MNFLFSFYFFGLILAMLQDLRRREVDDWLNLFLFFSGTAFILFNFQNFSIANYGFFVLFMGLISFGLYSGRFFAGGDAKLVFAMIPLFYENLFVTSMMNFFLFFIFLIFAGAVYGLAFLVYVSFRNRKNLKKEFTLNFKKNILIRYIFALVIILFFLSFVEIYFMLLAGFLLFFILLIIFAKSVEKVSFIIEKDTQDLAEGDWLEKDIVVSGKIIKSKWEGLSEEEIKFIRNYKKKIFIKDGIPYVPAFLIAFLFYIFKDFILSRIF